VSVKFITVTYICAISCAITNALVKPSSLIRAQLLVGIHIPVIGAYPVITISPIESNRW